MAHVTAAILSMGDELTLGQRLDTNSKWLATRLLELGITTVEHTTVPDEMNAAVGAFVRLASVADVVISTGGLGPTADDLCRAAVASASEDTLVEDLDALNQISALFATRGRSMPAINRVQALRPTRGACLPNTRGTAPGLAARVRASEVFCLPGPPGEMTAMFEACVLPRLHPPPGRTVRTRALHCFGIGESDLATRLGPLMDRARNPLVGTTASGGVVSIRVRYEGSGPTAEADDAMDGTLRDARDAAAPYCFGEDDSTLAHAALEELRRRGQTLGTVESCTGGLLGAMLTEIPGCSDTFVGGWVTYSNALKTAMVGVEEATLAAHGAVSRETALAMARGGLERSRADHALAITGIAGPGGAVPEKPVGTVWIARASRGARPEEARRFAMGGHDRQSVREWSARSAMMMLILHLRGGAPTKLLRQTEEYATA